MGKKQDKTKEQVKDNNDILDVLGKNRGKFKKKELNTSTTPKRGDGGDLL